MTSTPAWPSRDDVLFATEPYIDHRPTPWLEPEPITARLTELAETLEALAGIQTGLGGEQAALLNQELWAIIDDLERGRLAPRPKDRSDGIANRTRPTTSRPKPRTKPRTWVIPR